MRNIILAEKYNCIFSLGGNCSAAHNLQIRGLRTFSLPFDWLYVKDLKPLAYFCEGLEDCFRNFCLKENLVEIPPDNPEYGIEHLDRIKYIDLYTGYRFVNHFNKGAAANAEYDRVSAMLRRRIDRFYEVLSIRNGRYLAVFAPYHDVPAATTEELKRVQNSLRKTFPAGHFDIAYCRFGAKEDCCCEIADHIYQISISRQMNRGDFLSDNPEWNWMDRLSCAITSKHSRSMRWHWWLNRLDRRFHFKRLLAPFLTIDVVMRIRGTGRYYKKNLGDEE